MGTRTSTADPPHFQIKYAFRELCSTKYTTAILLGCNYGINSYEMQVHRINSFDNTQLFMNGQQFQNEMFLQFCSLIIRICN